MQEIQKPTVNIIGGTGQIGVATARRMALDGWSVLLAHRGETPGDASLADLDVTTVRLDRDNTAQLLELTRGSDLVVDTVAFDTRHADQLAQLAGQVGSLVVISSAAVYVDARGHHLGTAKPADYDGFPDFPLPITEDQPIVSTDGSSYAELKAAMERRLLDVENLPVSILRPAAIHGPFAPFLREWYFIKRALDHRERVPLAWSGTSRMSPSATSNIAELIALCAERPGKRVLNAVDDEAPSVSEMAAAVYQRLERDVEIVPFDGAGRAVPALGAPEGAAPEQDGRAPERHGPIGDTPWSVPKPFVLSMKAARDQLGYRPEVSYEKGLADDIDWSVRVVHEAEEHQRGWEDVFPSMVRQGADTWFDYEGEDALLEAMGR